ncbi:MAG: PQQ-dependent sugar dehydrogenase [Elainella sp. Prado103]|nr:PQQ-dependent sugar dehydrogenase [Elainella sp. Prado103]
MNRIILRVMGGTVGAIGLCLTIGCTFGQSASQMEPAPPATPASEPATSPQTAQTTPTPSPPTNSPPVLTAGDVPAALGIRAVTVIAGLEHPWGLAWLPDGSILITERPGRLRLVRDGALVSNPIAGVPEVFAVGQGGLMDVAIDPNFAENRLIYLTYAHGTEAENRTRVARARLENDRLNDLQVIFEATPAKSGNQHFGSRMVWLPDGTLLVSIGDGGNPPLQIDGELSRWQAQDRQSHLGKIVRLNPDGSIPADNPFVEENNTAPAIWSYGHRNIQGLAIDPATGQIWSTEHGSRGGDELNLIQAGNNYGWPTVSYSTEYATGEPISEERSRPGLVDPKLVWMNAIAPSGLTLYRGDRIPDWQGNLFAGGLVAQEVRRIILDSRGNVASQEAIAIGQRVRDVRQSPDGLLYVITDADNGQLIRLEPGTE